MDNNKGTKALGQEGTKYCILENDGVGLCVCKHRPCEQLQRAKAENEQLKKSIDRIMQNKEIKTIDSEIALLNAELQQENKRLKARLRPLEDSYFNGLSNIEIAELAKISIRITAENRKLEDALQEIREYCEEQNLKADYTACEIIAKINEVIGGVDVSYRS